MDMPPDSETSPSEVETGSADDDDWAEFASHDADNAETASMEVFPTWRKILQDSFRVDTWESNSTRTHVPIPAKSDLQEAFMTLVMKRNFERETSLPGRASLWEDILPVNNFLVARSQGLSTTEQPCLESRRRGSHLSINLKEVAFDLELPGLSRSTPGSRSHSPDTSSTSARENVFISRNPRNSRLGSESSTSLAVKECTPLPRSQSLAGFTPGRFMPQKEISVSFEGSLSFVCPSPEPELGFAQDIAAKGLARLSVESLREMHEEMTDKVHHLSDELVTGLEARDRLLRTLKTRNEFVASLLLLQNAVCGQQSRKGSESRLKVKRGENGPINKFLTAKLMYKGDASTLRPGTLERMAEVMNAMVTGSNDVSTRMTRYLAIDVFETDNDDTASPPITPFVVTPQTSEATADGATLTPVPSNQ